MEIGLEKILSLNGFSEKEAQIYLCALRFGEISISSLAKWSKINRTTLYPLIESMKKKGFVQSLSKKGIKYVSVLPPHILVERFRRVSRLAENILPNLIELEATSPYQPQVQFFDGILGVEEVLLEFSRSKTPSFGFTNYESMPKEIFNLITQKVIFDRRKNKNFFRALFPKNAQNEKILSENIFRFSEHRFLNFDEKISAEFLCFSEKRTAFLVFEKEENFAIIIDSSVIFKTMKNMFEILWCLAKK